MNRNIFRILIVDDEKEICETLKALFEREKYDVTTVQDAAAGLKLYQEQPFNMVFTDIRMPEMNGVTFLKQLKLTDSDAIVVMMTGYSSVQNAVEAMKLGASDYITKPFVTAELKHVVKMNYLNQYLTTNRNIYKQEILRKEFPELVGRSKALHRVIQDIKRVADAEVAVLITGESGTGKEIVAGAIHHHGSRKHEPFVPINCAAIPRDLLESELFGHEKGAFSGAHQTKYGLLEVADRGTLFLDEIGEMPLDLQAKLLRAVERKAFRRIGGTVELTSDFRIVCSTNRSFKEEIAAGRFREDLYYRLSRYHIEIPPLRDRPEDIPLLAANSLKKFNHPDLTLPDSIMTLFKAYLWPGNVRELENVMERLCLINRGGRVQRNQLPPEIQKAVRKSRGSEANSVKTLQDVEKEHLLAVYQQFDKDKVKTAKALDIGLKTLYRKLESYTA